MAQQGGTDKKTTPTTRRRRCRRRRVLEREPTAAVHRWQSRRAAPTELSKQPCRPMSSSRRTSCASEYALPTIREKFPQDFVFQKIGPAGGTLNLGMLVTLFVAA